MQCAQLLALNRSGFVFSVLRRDAFHAQERECAGTCEKVPPIKRMRLR